MIDLAKFTLIISLLMSAVIVKYYFFLHPSQNLFFLSNSDIMLKAPEFLKRPTPIPYVENYIEYPVLIGILATAVAYVSRNADEFFLFNGLVLSFLMTVNIFLSRELSWLVFGRRVSLIKFLVPSVLFFTFYNWDAAALFFLLLSLFLFYRGRFFLGALFSVLGFWTKIFPIFSAVVLSLDFLRRGLTRKLIGFALLGVSVALLLNGKYYLLNAKGLLVFFEFSKSRPPNIDSVWSSLYVFSDKIFGPTFFLKPYYNSGIGLVSLGLFVLLVSLFFWRRWQQRNFHYLWDTVFLVASFLLTSKVYSPQFNLWLAPLLIIGGLNFKKIIIYDLLNLLVAWAVYQYFWEVFIAGRNILSFPYFKLFTVFVFLRHAFLLWLTWDLCRLRKNYD